MNKVKTAHFVGIALAFFAAAGPARADYIITADSIYRHIAVLAHDSLEGRQVGEIGEQKAARYIQDIFTSAGLEPKGADSGYLQPFDFVKRIDLGENNRLTVNGIELMLNEEFLPMRQSATMKFDFAEIVSVGYGFEIDDDEGIYNDYEDIDVVGKAVLIKRFAPASDDSTGIDFDKYSTITDKVNTALGQDVAGIFLITPEDHDDTMLTAGPVRVHPKDVPVIWLRRKGLEKLGLNLAEPEISTAFGETQLHKTRDTGYNVVGYMPTGNDTTVIIGAHYDHLGWGSAASRYTGEEKMIHNGADDNASGTACLLELARYYSSRRHTQEYSTLFIAFSGEEEGILGSTNFARNMTVDSSKVRMMVNMDMVGRLKEQENGLAVFGTGTCQEFKDYFDSLSYDDVKMVSKVSGIGGSDHMAFYNRHIPVLNFFTGAHEDYHKPSDDLERIDLEGTARVANIVADVVNHFDGYGGPLVFQRTKSEEGARHRARYSVTLGIIPDFVSEVAGLRVDGVSLDRPGDRAGLLEGDIIIKMGETVVGDIYDYMSILGKFRKGDSTRVVIERGQDTLQLEVIFE